MKKLLTDTLKEKGWTEITADWEYRKDNWFILRDTSSWWMVGTDSNPRVFDVHDPAEYESAWTANLIEYLCMKEDEIVRLKNSFSQNSTK